MHCIVYESVLSVFTQEYSFVVRLHERPENEPPQKLVSTDFFMATVAWQL